MKGNETKERRGAKKKKISEEKLERKMKRNKK